MCVHVKPILSIPEQIAHAESKGIRFDIMSKDDAAKYLSCNNNYFKIRIYRKDFDKFNGGKNAGKYINLDFAMLKDLAIIDMMLRQQVIHMALDTEHFLAVKLLRKTVENNEDGYAIVRDYFSSLQARDQANNSHHYDQFMAEINRNNGNSYCGGIVAAYQNNYPIWAFLEIISLGSLIHFYSFCAERFDDNEMRDDFLLMKDVRELRNAAAHNNCIFHSLGEHNQRHTPNYKMMSALNVIPHKTRQKRLSNEHIRQLTTLLYVHTVLVTSDGVRNNTSEELDKLIARMERHIDYYSHAPLIVANIAFIKRVIDVLYKKSGPNH